MTHIATHTHKRNTIRTIGRYTALGTLIGAGAITGLAAIIRMATFDTQSSQSSFAYKDDPRVIAQDPVRQYRDMTAEHWFEATQQPCTTRGYDHTPLHGWRFDPHNAHPLPHTYAICMHGYTGNPQEMAPWAYHYANLGFTVIVPAQRGHELSDGRYVTMGELEHRDVLRWINDIVAQDPQARILLHGNSMGASSVLLACGDKRVAPHVQGVIADSAYANLDEQLTHSVSHILHMPNWLIRPSVAVASVMNRLHFGFSFQQVSPLQAVRRMHTPVVFMQGLADETVNPADARRLYAACASNDATLVEVKDAPHTVGFAFDPDLYWSTIDDFVARNFPRES